MKTMWQTRTLGELCSFIRDGNWIESKDQSPSGIRLVQTGNIGNGQFLNKAERSHFVSEQTFSDLRCEEIFPGDVLISRLPEPIGRSCVVPDLQQRMITAVDCTIARFDKKQCSKKYFVYFSQSLQYLTTIRQYCTGTTRSRISRKNLEKIRIPIPLLSEQERIVGILDAVFEKIDTIQRNAERNLANAKELFQQVLDEELTPKNDWKKALLKDISLGITDGDHLPPPKKPSGVPFITISNITDQQTIDFTSTFFVSLDYYNNLTSIRKARDGDILYTVTGSYGIPVLIKGNKQFCFQRHIAIIRPNPELINPLFLSFLLESKNIKRQADITATGVAQKTVSLTSLRQFNICFPSLLLQKSIANKIELIKTDLFKIMEKYKKTIAYCSDLKQQFLTQAFNGEL